MQEKNIFLRILWLFLGSFFLLLAIVGIFLPILPVLPLLIISSGFFFKGSRRIYRFMKNKIIDNKFFKKYLEKHFLNKKRIIWVKIALVFLLWLWVGFTSFFIFESYAAISASILSAIGVSVYISLLKPIKGKSTN